MATPRRYVVLAVALVAPIAAGGTAVGLGVNFLAEQARVGRQPWTPPWSKPTGTRPLQAPPNPVRAYIAYATTVSAWNASPPADPKRSRLGRAAAARGVRQSELVLSFRRRGLGANRLSRPVRVG